MLQRFPPDTQLPLPPLHRFVEPDSERVDEGEFAIGPYVVRFEDSSREV
jgi:hypothetical protein